MRRGGVEDETNKKAAQEGKKKKKKETSQQMSQSLKNHVIWRLSFFYLAAGAMVCAAPDSSRELVTCSMSLWITCTQFCTSPSSYVMLCYVMLCCERRTKLCEHDTLIDSCASTPQERSWKSSVTLSAEPNWSTSASHWAVCFE